jgi:anti-sigma B factor antagonist
MAKSLLDVMTIHQSGVVVARPTGWVTPDNSSYLEERIKLLIDGGSRRIVIDLSAAHFVSSTGLGVLIHFKKVLEDCGGCLLLACPSSAVSRILFTTRLSRVLECCDTVAEAVQLAAEKKTSGRHQTSAPTG